MIVQVKQELIQLNHDLVLLKKAANAIDEVSDLPTVLNVRDQAEALQAMIKRYDYSKEILLTIGTIKVKSERRMGELLAQLELDKGGRIITDGDSNRSQHGTGWKLKDLGISKSDSSRWQHMAKLPKKDFNAYVHTEVEENRQPTTASVMREVKKYLAVRRTTPQKKHEGLVTDLNALVEQGKKFSTIYGDFPWDYRNKTGRGAANLHYPTLTVSQLAELPIAELADKSALLFLWTTSSFLPESLQLIEGYGFNYKSSFVWVKSQLGVGNYWRISHEILMVSSRAELDADHEYLLLGTRKGEPFQDTNFRSWQEYPRSTHSQKPEPVRQMIERVGLPSRLELFGRRLVPGWTVFGNQLTSS